MNTYYVVHKGRIPGIYSNWNQCKKQIDKFEGAIFKKFNTENEANEFLKKGFGDKKPRSVIRKETDDKRNYDKIKNELNNEVSINLDNNNDDILDESFIDKLHNIINSNDNFNNEDINLNYINNLSVNKHQLSGTKSKENIIIYTDGSCISLKNNIKKAGYGIYIPDKNIKAACPLLNQKLTNNRAEITAIIECIKYLDENDLVKKICIFTDSQYSIYIFNGTGERYEKDGYKNNGKDVPNIDLIKKILELKRKYNIVLLKIRAHTGKKDEHSIGNEIADKLANDGALSTLDKKNNEFISKDNEDYIEQNNFNSSLFSEEYYFKKNMNLFDDESCSKDLNNIKKTFFNKSNKDDVINKEIQMNELFEFEETEEKELSNLLKYGKKNKNLKNIKLSNWFIKSK
jgi:ribonuclease HI